MLCSGRVLSPSTTTRMKGERVAQGNCTCFNRALLGLCILYVKVHFYIGYYEICSTRTSSLPEIHLSLSTEICFSSGHISQSVCLCSTSSIKQVAAARRLDGTYALFGSLTLPILIGEYLLRHSVYICSVFIY